MKKAGLLVALLSISVAAQADDFKVVNSTNNELSFSINHACSSEFGSIPAHSNKTVPSTDFAHACARDPHHCVANVYVDDNCSGKHVATLVFDTDFGLRQVLKGGEYTYTWYQNHLLISEGI